MPDPLPVPDPTIHRRRLRSELRKARETAGYAQRDVAAAMDWSLSKLLRIETGAVGIATNDLRMLLQHYGITDASRVQTLVETARAARERSPWGPYRDLGTPQFISFLAYETAASVIRSYQPVFVPGLLQTEEYAREVLAQLRGPDQQTVDRLVDLRMARQELVDNVGLSSFHFILDQSVLYRTIGGTGVMRRQLRRLKEESEKPNVTLRIVPFNAGIYPRVGTAYILFEFPDPENEDVLFIEDAQGDLMLRDMMVRESSPDELGTTSSPLSYLDSFFKLEQVARTEETVTLLDEALSRVAG
jgi:transcriptional regulator with XRE-family HTH domain